MEDNRSVKWKTPSLTEPKPRTTRREKTRQHTVHIPEDATFQAERSARDVLRWLGAFCTDDTRSVTLGNDGVLSIATYAALFSVDNKTGAIEFRVNQQALTEVVGK